MITLTYDEALALLRRAVEEKGADYKYVPPYSGVPWEKCPPGVNPKTCFYFRYGEPSCIIGHVLAYKGLTQNSLGTYSNRESVNNLISKGVIATDERTRRLLGGVQSSQDHGSSWGTAVEYGIHYASRPEVVA